MERPEVMMLGQTAWRLKWSRKAVSKLLPPGQTAAGATQVARATIAVEPLPRNPVLEREVLLHEVLHACVSASSLDVPIDQEEPLVAAIAPRLLEALRQNPALIRYLLDPKP